MSATNAPQWWSDSQQRYVPLSDLHGVHLQRAWDKLIRLRYRPEGREVTPMEMVTLRKAIEEEVARRKSEG